MAEFQEVMKQRNRMCKSFLRENGLLDCTKCPIFSRNTQSMWDCKEYAARNPIEFEDIVLEWAEKHPIKTNADKFKEIFGFDWDGCCKGKKIDLFNYKFEDNCKKDFWAEEYKDPKGDKTND